MVRQRFKAAVQQSDHSSAVRFAKLYVPLGLGQEGLSAFSGDPAASCNVPHSLCPPSSPTVCLPPPFSPACLPFFPPYAFSPVESSTPRQSISFAPQSHLLPLAGYLCHLISKRATEDYSALADAVGEGTRRVD